MKVYSIGREAGCDIVINDNSDATSRRHATLTVMPSGKMTITDQSRNGTYVNGERLNQVRKLKLDDRIMVGYTEILIRW